MIQLHRRLRGAVCLFCLGLAAATLYAQTPAQPSAQPAQRPAANAEPAPQGKVLFQSHGDAPQPAAQQPATPPPTPEQVPENAKPQLTDTDRAAIRITSYDLDIRITPAESKLIGRARLTLRNASDKPLPRLALEISSTLTWTSASVQGSALPIEQHLLDTDADHTGQARELILTLHTPLAPGDTLAVETFYSGAIQPNGGRLERLGASPAQALQTDWDAITPDSTFLRGFGNVLWFPIAAPQLFLSDGTLVPAIGRERLEHAATPISLRLSVEYTGEPPTAAYFCGRRQPLAALHDNADAPIASGAGIATAIFPAEPIGIRPLSLFLIEQPESMIAPLPSDSPTKRSTSAPPMLAVETTDDRALPLLAASAERVAPLLQQWLGPHPLTALTIIDHSGQPFEDGPLLVAPIGPLGGSDSAPMLAHSLTHAWVQTGQPWMDEGLAEFFTLLWIEQQSGRDAAIKQLDALMQPVAAADNLTDTAADTNSADTASSSSAQSSVVGQPLIAASDELFFRRKAAAVWWMLREIAGQQPLQLALSAWRTQLPSHNATEASPEQQALAFEALLEKTSGKDLAWFFNDWILHDRGLPTLSIVDVVPRELPAGTGHDKGWLVAVTVHNAGAAVADVPLVVRAGELTVTRRMRIPGLSNATERVIVQSPPTDVTVNDGSTPESGPSVHTRTVVAHQE